MEKAYDKCCGIDVHKNSSWSACYLCHRDTWSVFRMMHTWAGLCPGDNESAKKRKSKKTRKGNALLREALVNCIYA